MKPTLIPVCLAVAFLWAASAASAEFQAGAAVVDVTPAQLPVLVNGGMLSRSADKVKTPVNARAIVLDDGRQRLAIVVVDSCMMPRPLLDEAKQLAAQRTKIRADHMLIAATHSHSAPSCMGCLGTDADPAYVPFCARNWRRPWRRPRRSWNRRAWAGRSADAAEYTALRRWIRRPDRIDEDPFGNPTVRANMHAGRNWDDVTGESGPEDPELSLISLQAKDGRPLAVLANFSMHYFGDAAAQRRLLRLVLRGAQVAVGSRRRTQPRAVCRHHVARLQRRYLAARLHKPADARRRRPDDRRAIPNGLLQIACAGLRDDHLPDDADLAMAEARLQLKYRVPDKQRLEWAQRIVAAMGDRPPKDTTEVYAREQIILHERQSTEVVVQALRIGDIGIATTPTETYALTGLKLKLQSPLRKTMVIELANGGDGYIPPPEQHLLGGYNTWAARSAGLEVQAEPKIAEAALQLLEAVAGQPRREFEQSCGPAAKPCWPRSPRPTGGWTNSPVPGPSTRPARTAMPSTSRAWCSSWKARGRKRSARAAR